MKKNKYFDIYAPVFYPAAVIVLTVIIISFFFSAEINSFFTAFQKYSSNNAGWFFILATNIFLAYSFYFAFSKYGKIRIGGPDAKPEYSTFSWFSMLFSAGIGIGLMYYGVAEPIFHFTNPPMPMDSEGGRIKQAMVYTFLHWGFHGWATYAIIGLGLAYFTYNKGLPLTVRSLFYPLIGDGIYGWKGSAIDVLAVVATIFGLSTTLGMGVKQVGAGLNFLFEIPNTISLQILLIAIITLAATASVVLGMDKGVKFLSVLNMRLTIIFMVGMLIIGPTSYIMDGFVQNTGQYLSNLMKVGTWAEAYTGGTWQNDWTIFYWAWWISWSPFVGIFIARISKGRTVKEFLLSVLIVPSIFIFLWMSVFGGTAIFLETSGLASISEAVNADLSTSLFVLLSYFPFSFYTSLLGMFLIVIFFVTSSDSGSLVVDSITSGGKLDAPVGQRIFWALMEGCVAAALLFAGGLKALQAMVISAAIPFACLLLFIIYSLIKSFRSEDDKNMQ